MKSVTILAIAAMAMAAATGCSHDNPAPSPEPPAKGGEFNEFDFVTNSPVTLSVDYGRMGGLPANVYFEVYDTCPVRETETAYVKIEGIEPLYAGYTDAEGRFEGTIDLPSYVQKAYVYTTAFYARTLMEATRSGDKLTASAESGAPATASAASTRAKEYYSTAVKEDGWKTWLGSYDSTYGSIGYEYKGDLKVKNYRALLMAHASVFDTTEKCPEEYRSSRDLYLAESAEVVITLLGSNSCWNSSLGYYYYKEGNKPRTLADANVVMIFPNTQDGQWSNDWQAIMYQGVERGSAVQLMYYPEIANGSEADATTVFPADYRIGFVLATNAWTNRLRSGDKKYRAATSSGLSVDNNGNAYQTPRTAVFRYTDEKQGINSVLFSFEDHINDENFSDVVFTLSSNPVDAVQDIPSVDVNEGKKTTKVLRGIYAFEDLWPSRGDYDMNDVMVRSDYEKVFNEKGIYEESFMLKTFANYAGNANGLAVTLTGAAASAELEFSVRKPGSEAFEAAEFQRDGNVVLLTPDVKQLMGSAYRITAKYDAPIAEKQAGTIKPFIYRTDRDGLTAGKRWEVHIPYEKPTSLAEMSFFGTNDDKSIPEKGIYYVRAENYPFAFFLSGATDADVARLLDLSNEKSPIDKVYPAYAGWAASNGKENTDWYKK